MTEAQVYRIAGNSTAEINLILAQLSDRLDEMQGLRGEAKIYGDLNLQDNAITNAGAGTFLSAYPVGALYLSTSGTDPGTIFGGTWARYGEGRMMIGYSSTDADFGTVDDTGGSKTKDFGQTGYWHNAGDGGYIHSGRPQVIDDPEVAPNASIIPNSILSDAEDIMPPYVVVYVWRRTA